MLLNHVINITVTQHYLQQHSCTYIYNCMFEDSLTALKSQGPVFLLILRSSENFLSLFCFSKFEFTCQQPVSVPDFGWRVKSLRMFDTCIVLAETSCFGGEPGIEVNTKIVKKSFQGNPRRCARQQSRILGIAGRTHSTVLVHCRALSLFYGQRVSNAILCRCQCTMFRLLISCDWVAVPATNIIGWFYFVACARFCAGLLCRLCFVMFAGSVGLLLGWALFSWLEAPVCFVDCALFCWLDSCVCCVGCALFCWLEALAVWCCFCC